MAESDSQLSGKPEPISSPETEFAVREEAALVNSKQERAEERARRKQERAEQQTRTFEARVAQAAAMDAAQKRAAEAERAKRRAEATAQLSTGPVRFRVLCVTVHKGTVYKNDRPLGPLARARAVCGPVKVTKERYQGATLAFAVAWSGVTKREVSRMTVTVATRGQKSTVTAKGSMQISAARKEADKFNLLAEGATP